MTSLNISARLVQQPTATVLIPCSGSSAQAVSAAQLLDGCRRTAEALHDAGVRRGHKAVVMTRDPYEFVAAVYALHTLGAVPVLSEPRADVRRCLDEVAPEVFIGEPLAHLGRRILGWGRGHVRVPLVTGRAFPGRGLLLGRGLALPVPDGSGPPPDIKEPAPGDLAMIAFTSGSTGRPKGVEYRYSTLAGQLTALATVLKPQPGDILLSGFLPITLIGPLLGLTTIAPAINHLAPARTPPEHLVTPVQQHQATAILASPAVLAVITRHCARHRLTLPSVNRVLSFGAPLRPGLADALADVLQPNAEILSVYGATECLPVSVISARDLRALPPAGHAGTCLGRPLAGLRARILDADPTGLGEIAVAGPVVSPAYHARPDSNAAAKSFADCGLLHRTGDLGRLDGQGRLWYLGRKADLVTGDGFSLTTEDVEKAADAAPGVRRTALVGIGPAGRQQPVLCVETRSHTGPDITVASARAALDHHPQGHRVQHIVVHPRFPTDHRHNSKIDRIRLSAWAARRLRRIER
ncbi:AMP-binding protein [Streptomyces sp. ACA25]|uniref:AMP-binding protein n=1 Tax=Streptomyces sp. ACA25 TaxID=3022596 RepID=UPI0023075215|nr:AMP-binding protein [Streptomyces sp. ACA25]MDB1090267.1 AMP-binding protein [Streptomyces sp. ACA25]